LYDLEEVGASFLGEDASLDDLIGHVFAEFTSAGFARIGHELSLPSSTFCFVETVFESLLLLLLPIIWIKRVVSVFLLLLFWGKVADKFCWSNAPRAPRVAFNDVFSQKNAWIL